MAWFFCIIHLYSSADTQLYPVYRERHLAEEGLMKKNVNLWSLLPTRLPTGGSSVPIQEATRVRRLLHGVHSIHTFTPHELHVSAHCPITANPILVTSLPIHYYDSQPNIAIYMCLKHNFFHVAISDCACKEANRAVFIRKINSDKYKMLL